MKMFVGNLSFEADEKDVRRLFEGFGKVSSVTIVMDKKGKSSRGFGFLEMPDDEEAKAAIVALHRQEFMGRPLNVETARPKPEGFLEESAKKHKIRQQLQQPKEAESRVSLGQPQAPGFQRGAPRGSRRAGFMSGSHYKQGRRTRSFMKRRAEAGITEPVIERKFHENPMRWRKKKPWLQSKPASSPHKTSSPLPWEKKKGQARDQGEKRSAPPWQKKTSSPRPAGKKGFQRRKRSGGFKR
ncbi:MAG: RNA-binding protein [Candidatus Omnitrophica bacterium]|nr:RNA-binding protein [Candidatus Omnitrophota bacterium]